MGVDVPPFAAGRCCPAATRFSVGFGGATVTLVTPIPAGMPVLVGNTVWPADIDRPSLSRKVTADG